MDLNQVRAESKDYTVLYVEDEEAARSSTVEIFKMLFKNVKVAEDGKAGLDEFEACRESIDLVISDVNMPVMNGLEMTRKIKELDPFQHVIIISAHNELRHLSEAVDLGVEGFVLKPVNADKLLASIHKICLLISAHKMELNYQQHLEDELKCRTMQLQKTLVTDDLTGVPNKVSLNQEFMDAEERTVFLVNLDNFDHVNSTYGYDYGDEVLKSLAEVLIRHTPDGVKLFRLASDEFVFLIEKIEKNALMSLAEEIKSSVENHHVAINDLEINVTCTIGIAQGKGKKALVDAHVAMKEVREIGKNRFYLYNHESELQKRQQKNILWMKKVKQAINQGLILPYFQPIICNNSGQTVKYECLARIREFEKVITPYYFIEPARLVGLLPNITKIMIEKCFHAFSKREESLSINITENDLKEGYLPEFLNDMLQKFDILPEQVTLEILENISAQGSEEALEQLKALKAMHFKLALDDFGSEKSNFYRLQELCVDYIKIDGMFIRNLDTNANSHAIVKTIVHLAESIGAEVIAEFVHSEEIHEIVKNLGIHYSQGYLFGEPRDNID